MSHQVDPPTRARTGSGSSRKVFHLFIIQFLMDAIFLFMAISSPCSILWHLHIYIYIFFLSIWGIWKRKKVNLEDRDSSAFLTFYQLFLFALLEVAHFLAKPRLLDQYKGDTEVFCYINFLDCMYSFWLHIHIF